MHLNHLHFDIENEILRQKAAEILRQRDIFMNPPPSLIRLPAPEPGAEGLIRTTYTDFHANTRDLPDGEAVLSDGAPKGQGRGGENRKKG